MRNFGLVGNPVSHSFSKKYFTGKFLKEGITYACYKNFNLKDISELPELIKENNLSGLNITIPYKESVIPFLDEISDVAKEIRAVNTIKNINGKLFGFNTDILGFEKSFFPLLQNKKTALILGNGGSSKAIQFVLNKLNINFQLISRNTKLDYHNITKETIDSVDIIINCTPVGSYPKTNEYPKLPYSLLNSKHLLYDLVYNPKRTKFLTFGLANNCSIKNGEEMLVIQAEESWNIWNSDIR